MLVGAVASVCRDADDVARLVVRHHRVRVALSPVLTVLAGPVASAERLLAALDRGLGRDMVAVDDVGRAATAWAERITASARLRLTLATRLAARPEGRLGALHGVGLDAARPEGRLGALHGVGLDAAGPEGRLGAPHGVGLDAAGPEGRLGALHGVGLGARPARAPVALRVVRTLHDWRRLLGAAGLDDGELGARLAQTIAAEDARGLARLVDARGRFATGALDALVALVGAAALPGLRVRAATQAQLERAAALAVALVDRPPLAAELVAPWSVAVGWLDEPSGARSRGLVADGLVRLPDRGVRVSQRFRSRPERLLHQALEAEPTTRGRFVANQKLGPYGAPARKIEVDLLCAHHRLVVEVDGFFHEQDGARARDAQRDGWLACDSYQVMRVSADEVVADPVQVARRIAGRVAQAVAAAAQKELQPVKR